MCSYSVLTMYLIPDSIYHVLYTAHRKNYTTQKYLIRTRVYIYMLPYERLPKLARGANGRNIRGVAFQVFPSFYRVLASFIHA